MKLLKATAALLAIAAVLVGPPVLLVQVGWPLPEHPPSLDELWAVMTRPPSDRLLLNTAVVLGWVLWAAIVRAFAAELWAQVRGAKGTGTGEARAYGPLRWVAAALIAAVISAGPAAAALPAEAEPITVVGTTDPTTIDLDEREAASDVFPQRDGAEEVVHVVERGDTLWDIASDEDYLADPLRYPEIFEANEGVIQDDGRALEDEDLIYPGWKLTIPVTEDTADTEDEPEPTPQDDQPEPEPTTGPEEEAITPATEPSQAPTDTVAETDPPNVEDGVVPAPPVSEPDETPTAASPTNRADVSEPPTSAAESPASASTDWFQAGIWLTAGTFLAATTAFSLLVLLRRRRLQAQEHDPDGDRTLTGRLADLEVLFDNDDLAVPPPDTVMPLAANTNGRASADVSLLDWAGDGLGLSGPGAPGVIRAALINAATSHMPVIITTSAAETIGLDPTAPAPWLTVVPGLDAALDRADERIEDPVYDLNVGRIDLPPMLLIADSPPGHDQRLSEALKHDLIGALLLGGWESAELTIAADGTVTDHHPAATGLDEIERCYIADAATLSEALTVTEPPRPEPSTPAPKPSTVIAEPEAEPDEPTLAAEPKPKSEAAKTTEAPLAHGTPVATPSTRGQARLILLGPPALLWNGKPIQWRRRRSLLLLAALASAEDGLTLDDLLVTVVGDGHDITKARGHLGTVASDTRRDFTNATGLNIRAVFHDDQTDRYRLHPDITTDLADFHHHRNLAATATTDTERRNHLANALTAYGDDFATGLEDDWLDTTRTELRQAAYTTCLHLAALHRDTGDLKAATTILERATAIDRTHPEAWTTLIETRTALGDEVGAQKARRGHRLGTSDHSTTPT